MSRRESTGDERPRKTGRDDHPVRRILRRPRARRHDLRARSCELRALAFSGLGQRSYTAAIASATFLPLTAADGATSRIPRSEVIANSEAALPRALVASACATTTGPPPRRRTRARAVPIPAVVRSTQVEDPPAGGARTHDLAKRVHVPESGDRRTGRPRWTVGRRDVEPRPRGTA